MAFLLDSNAWITLLRNKIPKLTATVRAHPPADLFLCAIADAELVYGAHRSADPAKHLALIAAHPILPFDTASAHVYGRIRFDLESRGLTIGANDYLIASIALANNLTLVTHNTREFSRVPGLQLEDWQ